MRATELAAQLAARAEAFCRYLLPQGKRIGHEWCCGSVNGEPGESLKVHLTGDKAGVWADFATPDDRGDLMGLLMAVRQKDLHRACQEAIDFLGLRDDHPPPLPKHYLRPNPHTDIQPLGPTHAQWLLDVRKLPDATVSAYGVGSGTDACGRPALAFPYWRAGALQSVKTRTLKKEFMRTKGSMPCLFGWHVIPPSARALVLVEGELDAMAWHAYGVPALSVPMGGGNGGKQDWIDIERERLAAYDTIFIGMDNDDTGHAAEKAICERLGPCCRVVRLPYKDANECLMRGVSAADMKQALAKARPFTPPTVDPVGSLPASIRDALQRTRQDPGALFEPDVLEAIRRMRECSVANYERFRHVAKAAKVSVGRLDHLTVPPKDEDDTSLFPEDEPWPEPTSAAEVVALLLSILHRFVIADPSTLVATALWIMHTWVLDAFSVSPLAHISSPLKRCGKTVLLTVIQRLAYRPLATSNITPAALFRSIEKWQPTLCIDEVDSFLKASDEARGLINSGLYRDQAFVIRAEGDDHIPTQFSTWAAKVLCGIGKLPDTIEDRSIPLAMRRKLPREVAQSLRRSSPTLWQEARSKLKRWSTDDLYELERFVPRPIPGLHDRAQDCWEPLAAIAQLAGGIWPHTAEIAASTLQETEEDEATLDLELLADVRTILDQEDRHRCFSERLMERLTMIPDAPWATYNRGKAMTMRQLARRLAAFGIHPGTIRMGDRTAKGYKAEDLAEAFARYLSAPGGNSNVTPSQRLNHATYGAYLSVTPEGVCRIENRPKALPDINCDGVTDNKPILGERKKDDGGGEPDAHDIPAYTSGSPPSQTSHAPEAPPAPGVRPMPCSACRHFQPDAINPVAGMGRCARAKGAYYPMQMHPCDTFDPQGRP